MSEKMMLPGMSRGMGLPVAMPTAALQKQVVDFVAGRNNGGELMLAIYGDVANEPLPPRFAGLLASWRTH
jgi:hypothetical protein